MRDMLLKEVYKLADITNDIIVDNLKTWSNKDLLDYYGDLRIEEYLQLAEKKVEFTDNDETNLN